MDARWLAVARPYPPRKCPSVNQMCKISPCVAQAAEPPVIAERRKLLSSVAGVEAVDMSGILLISTRRGQLDARDEN